MLFRSKSYVTEAIDVAAAKDVKPPTEKDVLEFIADAEKAAEETSYKTKAAASQRKNGVKTGKSTVFMSDPGGVELSSPYYQNYQSK